MKVYSPHIQKISKREIIREADGNNNHIKFYVYFITIYTWVGLFGKMHQCTFRKKDEFPFDNEDDAKNYANDADKPSDRSQVFPKNQSILFNNNVRILMYYDPDNKKYILNYRAEQHIGGDYGHWYYFEKTSKELKIKSLDEYSKYIERALTTTSKKVSVTTITDFGAKETKELEEKRNDLVDSEIKRSEEYIEFLKTLKK